MNESVTKKVDNYFSQHKQQKYKKGEILIRADDDPLGIFYLKKGFVKKYAISVRGDELIVNVFKPISFFPMSWAMNDTPNAYFYEAMTDLDIWRAPKEDVVAFIKSNPDVLYDLLSRVYKGTDGMLTRMTYLMAGNAYSRLIVELLIQAKRFGKKEVDYTEFKITEKDVAAQSGMTRETVSREMKRLKEKGFVTFSKNTLIIKDLGYLEKELEEGIQ